MTTAPTLSPAAGLAWAPPVAVRRALCRARRRLHAVPVAERPALSSPSNVGLFTLPELVALALAGYWPLPPRALAWLGSDPAERTHRKRRTARRIETVARRFMAAELPEAIAYLARKRS